MPTAFDDDFSNLRRLRRHQPLRTDVATRGFGLGDRLLQRRLAVGGSTAPEPQAQAQSAKKSSLEIFREAGLVAYSPRVRAVERTIGSRAPPPPPRVPNAPEELRDRVETATGENFSNVRVHTGEAVQRLAAETSSRAFTVGRDIGFVANAFRDASTSSVQAAVARKS
jgi:hypothetical protein